MTSIQEFLAQRGGRFTPEDIAYFASYGFQALVFDSVIGNGNYAPEPSDPPHPSPNQYVDAEIQAAMPVTERRRIGKFSVETVGGELENEVIESLAVTAAIMQQRAAPRIVILDPWVGEEIIAVAQAFGEDSTPEIFAVGEFEGDAREWTLNAAMAVGPNVIRDICESNLKSTGFHRVHLMTGPTSSPPPDNQDVSLLVIPPQSQAYAFRAWMPHMRNDGIVCGWGDYAGAIGAELMANGIKLQYGKVGGFWSIRVAELRKAIAARQAAGRPANQAGA